MIEYRIHPYGPRYTTQAAELLAKIRRDRREWCPLLPSGLDDAEASIKLLEGAGEGVVALARDGSLGGFLFAKRGEDPVWGPSVVADADGWALSSNADASVLAGLYAAGFEGLTPGIREHIVYCPSLNPFLTRGWFQLGFGMEQAYAAARIDDLYTKPIEIEGLRIRRARSGDEEILESLSPLIATMQAQAPVWAGAPASYLSELRKGFRGLAAGDEGFTLLAFLGGDAVGYQAWLPIETDVIDGRSEGALELSVSATLPEERGRGIGMALTTRGVSEARSLGCSACFTDWRTANPLSSAFWQARGFKPFLYRLVRRLAPYAAP